MSKFFASHSFKIIFMVIFLLPIMTRGARRAFQSNNNEVQDWLPPEYPETQEFNWFKQRFAKETFILASWEGCTLDDERLELFARKLTWSGPPEEMPTDWRFAKVETGQRVFQQLTTAPLNVPVEEAYKRLEGLFVGPDHKQTCAVITLTDHAKQSKNLRTTVEQIYAMAEKELGMPRERVKLGGPPIDSVQISMEGERTLMWLLGPAAVVGLGLAWWCLRSVRLTTMVFATALYAGAISLSIVWYSYGTMNAILLTMPAVVYVAGISGAIHFANYYRDTAVEEGVAGAPARAIRHAWLPCVLSAMTTAAGLFSLYTSELIPIQWFGVYSACGVLATLFLLFLFLPAWMQLWPMQPHSKLDGEAPRPEDLALPQRWRHFLGGLLGYHRWVFASLAVVMIFCGIGLTKIETSIKLTKMFSPNAQIIHDYSWLEEKIGPLVPMEIIVRLDNKKCKLSMLERMQLLRKVQDKLESINGIGNTMSAVTFAPPLKVKRAGLINARMMAGIIDKKIRDHKEDYVENGLLYVEGDQEMWRISARVGALNDIDYGTFIEDVKSQVEPVLIEQRSEIAAKAAKQAAPAAVEPVPAAAAALAAGDALAAADAEPAVDDQGIQATYTGLVPLVYKAQRSMLTGLAWNFVWDLATIAGVMTIVFWDLSAGLILLIPCIFPLFVVFGVMGWLGIVVDVGTVMTPTVALGVSVDDVVHFLIWYKKGLRQGRSRREAVMLAYEGCARAMYQSWAVLALGLFVFALSSFVPTQRFGALMFTLLTAALIGNLVLLPAVLNSPLAYFFLLGTRKKVARAKAAAELATSKVPAPHDAHEAVPDEDAVLPHMRRDVKHRSVKH